jgi:hypothetical protein
MFIIQMKVRHLAPLAVFAFFRAIYQLASSQSAQKSSALDGAAVETQQRWLAVLFRAAIGF